MPPLTALISMVLINYHECGPAGGSWGRGRYCRARPVQRAWPSGDGAAPSRGQSPPEPDQIGRSVGRSFGLNNLSLLSVHPCLCCCYSRYWPPGWTGSCGEEAAGIGYRRIIVKLRNQKGGLRFFTDKQNVIEFINCSVFQLNTLYRAFSKKSCILRKDRFFGRRRAFFLYFFSTILFSCPCSYHKRILFVEVQQKELLLPSLKNFLGSLIDVERENCCITFCGQRELYTLHSISIVNFFIPTHYKYRSAKVCKQ